MSALVSAVRNDCRSVRFVRKGAILSASCTSIDSWSLAGWNNRAKKVTREACAYVSFKVLCNQALCTNALNEGPVPKGEAFPLSGEKRSVASSDHPSKAILSVGES